MNNITVREIKKGWGKEVIWSDTDKYCGKFLVFDSGASFSMHFHAVKDETWYILEGNFKVITIDTTNATEVVQFLRTGDVWRNPPLLPHKLVCTSHGGGTIVEVSTKDSKEDNYRVQKGDSQSV